MDLGVKPDHIETAHPGRGQDRHVQGGPSSVSAEPEETVGAPLVS